MKGCCLVYLKISVGVGVCVCDRSGSSLWISRMVTSGSALLEVVTMETRRVTQTLLATVQVR